MAKEVTIKDNKQTIWDAYQVALKSLADAKVVNPRDAQVAAENEAAIKSAEKSVSDGVFSEEYKKKFEDLQTAIKIGKEELENLYGITAEADSFAAMLSAKKTTEDELNEKLTQKKNETDKAIKELEQNLKETKNRLDKEEKEYANELAKKRKRDEEEYKYNLARERKKENDAWEDEKAQREKTVSDIESYTEKLNQEAQERLTEFDSAQKTIVELEAAVIEAKETGLKEGKDKAGKEWAFEKRHMETTHKYEIDSRDKEITTLKSRISELNTALADTQTKLDNAYSQMREIATDTVKSAGGVKILDRENTK